MKPSGNVYFDSTSGRIINHGDLILFFQQFCQKQQIIFFVKAGIICKAFAEFFQQVLNDALVTRAA